MSDSQKTSDYTTVWFTPDEFVSITSVHLNGRALETALDSGIWVSIPNLIIRRQDDDNNEIQKS